jgi:hypothetical protein
MCGGGAAKNKKSPEEELELGTGRISRNPKGNLRVK